jgi:hypothetical protein
MSLIKRLTCTIKGHSDSTPIIEAWASRYGSKKSYYLCRRCGIQIGEKSYERV